MVNEYSKWLTKVGDEIGNWHSEIGNEGRGKANMLVVMHIWVKHKPKTMASK
jgi:hypothetical protein